MDETKTVDDYLGDASQIVTKWLADGYSYVVIPKDYRRPCRPYRNRPKNRKSYALHTLGGMSVARLWVAATLATGIPYGQ